jgi:dipeptidyl aminopeptidase/acylaminoacyl peptidase
MASGRKGVLDMRSKIMTLLLMASTVVAYSQRSDATFIDKVNGLREIGQIIQKGVEFRRPQISPDGRRIAFTSVSPESALWIADMDELKPRRLAKREDSAKIQQYTWSPDGRKIAYVDGRTVRLINVVTKEVTSYTTVSPFISDPVFDAEGNLAFVGNTELTGNPAALEGDVEKVKATTPKDRPYLEVVSNGKKRFIDDPNQLVGEDIVVPYVFSPGGELYVNINGMDERISPVKRPSRSTIACLFASLSPDRRKIAVECVGTNLFVYDIPRSKSYAVGLGAVGMRPCWSSDSEWILFLASIEDGHTVLATELHISHHTGGETIKLKRVKGWVHGASWGKDNIIAYDQEEKIVVNKIVMK